MLLWGSRYGGYLVGVIGTIKSTRNFAKDNGRKDLSAGNSAQMLEEEEVLLEEWKKEGEGKGLETPLTNYFVGIANEMEMPKAQLIWWLDAYKKETETTTATS